MATTAIHATATGIRFTLTDQDGNTLTADLTAADTAALIADAAAALASAPRPALATQPATPAPTAATDDTPPAPPAADASIQDIATYLRALPTMGTGQAYLDTQRFDCKTLITILTALGQTRIPSGLPLANLQDRILQQAIGARRKYAGLRTW